MLDAKANESATTDECSPVFFPQRQHLTIHVSGTVQGVGFRPFVFNLARRLEITGSVLNNSHGVTIHAQGRPAAIQELLHALQTSAPPAARVENVTTEELALAEFADFRILPSEALQHASTHLPPDLALCAQCRRELTAPADRRYSYPFINCIHCGPRFSIVHGLPYDRPLTTMRQFVMCDACRAEYENPADRRFHTQPISCPECGPTLRLMLATETGWQDAASAADPIAQTAAALRQGQIVLLQGIGGFHLACDARCDKTVQRLRQRKRRDEKPLAVMYPAFKEVSEDCLTTTAERDLLLSAAAPIVLLHKRGDCSLAPSVAPENPRLGVMLPYSPLHFLLLEQFAQPIVLTSANLSDEPIAYQVDDALSRLHGIADAALLHDRPIHMFADDSVTMVVAGQPRVWRRSRGYVPAALTVHPPFRVPVLAFGPHLKNTFCLGKQDRALLAQHLGDLNGPSALDAHAAALEHFLKLYDADVQVAACDLHPDYASTRLAEEWSALREIPLVRVQHHHAHLAACLAEHNCDAPAIGLCLDGTGYGPDGAIWGGEVLVGNAESYVRFAHLQEVPLLGGEAAVREPWRMALAWLYESLGDDWMDLPLPFVRQLRRTIGDNALAVLLHPRLRFGVFPRTSSLGRLFDAAAALTIFGMRTQFEGQAAMLLEGAMAESPALPYPVEISSRGTSPELNVTPLLRALLTDSAAGVDPAIISRRFHEGIVDGFARLCALAREQTGVRTVALTGGCFQNAFLLETLEQRLTMDGFAVLSHHTIPTGDGGVALGQAVIANLQGNR